MADSSLQDRLRHHAEAFNGLLSLIPAKTYYGQETSEEGNQKKKQSKKEAAAARRGKLDPDSELNRNAKEVMDERANNKRKLREMQQQDNEDEEDEEEEEDAVDEKGHISDSFEPIDGIEAEKPGEGLRLKKASKKQKLEDNGESDSGQPSQKLSRKEEKRATKRERKAEKKAEKKKAKREEPETTATVAPESHSAPSESKMKKKKKEKQKKDKAIDNDAAPPSEPQKLPSPPDTSDPPPTAEGPASSQEDGASKDDVGVQNTSSTSSESAAHSPVFDTEEAVATTADVSAEAASATTSISSTAEKCKHVKIPADTTALRARLAAKIEALRAARKADGPDGKPIRTRQELIESRRAKQAQRKAHKLELRRQAKLEEARKREEALASNSPGVGSPAGVDVKENLSFGRVVFGDGTQASRDLSYVLQKSKRKGPSDAKTALLKVQGQKKRLAELEPDKRADLADKEVWLTARRRVEGDKIRDDEATLKKAVRRKEAVKKKSKKAWRERTQGVELAQKERQKKREGNIQKRRDDKILGKAGKKKKKAAATTAAGGGNKRKAGRPGFEGSFGVGGRKK